MNRLRMALEEVLKKIRKEFGEMSVLRPSDSSDRSIVPQTAALALQAIANAQKEGGVAAFVDMEHAFDLGRARGIGVNLEGLLVAQPNSGEEALAICERLVESGAVDVVVVDSVAALTPKVEIDGDIWDVPVGDRTRLTSRTLRKLTATLARTNARCIFTDQSLERTGVKDRAAA